jgi:hypothetical protein
MEHIIEGLDRINALDRREDAFEGREPEGDYPAVTLGAEALQAEQRRAQKRLRDFQPDNWPSNDYPQVTRSDHEDIQKYGFEALAWYSPYHFYPDSWGVTIRNRGIEIVASSLISNGLDLATANLIAQKALIAHEIGHFQVENGVALLELSDGTGMYVKQKKAAGSSWCDEEEGLCNALAHQAAGSKHRRALEDFLDFSPAGYRDWRRHTPAKRADSWAAAIGVRADGVPRSEAILLDLKSSKKFVTYTFIQDGSGPAGSVFGT